MAPRPHFILAAFTSFFLFLGGADAPTASPPAQEQPTPPPTTQAVDPRIETLLDELESADAQARDRAMQGLIRVGPSAVDPLEARLKEAPSPELVSRARLIKDGITRAWRYWDPAGGKISGGFQASLQPVDDVLTFKAGSPILLNVQIRNVSPDARQLTDIRGFDVDLADHAVFESPFCDARVIIRRVDAAPMPREGHPVILATENPRMVDFKTGGNILTPVRIDEGVSLPPGEYEVRVVYYAKTHNLVANAVTDLEAGPIRFKMTSEPVDAGAKSK